VTGTDVGLRRLPRLRLSLTLIALTAGGTAILLSCNRTVAYSEVSRARLEMGTLLEIVAVGPRSSTEEAVAAAFRSVEEVDRRLSNWKAESELSRANASREPFALSGPTFRSLTHALTLAAETDGAFDPTVGVFTGAPMVGWRNVVLDPAARTLAFRVAGGAIDSGGFGKGEALDAAVREIRRRGVAAARLNFGGQISAFGREFRKVALVEPRAGSSRVLCTFSIAGDGSVSTSAVSEKPGHIVDPRTGRPAAFFGSVTVVSDTGVRADALSTALFVLGPDAGLEFANCHGISALFAVPRDGGGWQLRPSRGFPRFHTTVS
jgi:FAD:protein FMN transferase